MQVELTIENGLWEIQWLAALLCKQLQEYWAWAGHLLSILQQASLQSSKVSKLLALPPQPP